MKIIKYITILLILAVSSFTKTFAQHEHGTQKQNEPSADKEIIFDHVLTQALTDPQLADYELISTVMTIMPGVTDTVSHRHDCELFGYILEGEVEIALVSKKPKRYQTGQMFYEKRNVLHTLTRNADNKTEAKVLLIFIIKNGRAGYIAEFPDKVK